MTGATKFISAGLLVAWVVFSGTSAEAQGLPEGEGKAAIEDSCNLCHGLNYITQSSRTATEWRNVVSDMVARGAPLTKDEFEQVLQYLATHFGPENASNTPPANGAKP